MSPQLIKVTLESLDDGDAVEAFNSELQKAIANIADSRTAPKKKRVVILQVVLMPNEQRDGAIIGYEVTSKLAGPKPTAVQVYLGKDRNGEQIAATRDPQQAEIFDVPESAAPEGAVNINRGERKVL